MSLTNTQIEQMKQLLTVTWDGDLISKSVRTELEKEGLVDRIDGYNFLTKAGVHRLVCEGYLRYA